MGPGAAALLLAVSPLASAPAAQQPLTVSAAVSLTGALEELAAAWTAGGGPPLRFNFAASNVLARQIVAGAPVDLFLSADDAQMDVVEKANGLRAGSRGHFVRNQLAVVAAPERAGAVREGFARAPAEIRRLALGDPEAVPAGVYARRYLERRGLWSAYAPRVVPTGSVRAALAAVANGSADAAIVYVSDARASRRAAIAFEIPVADAPEIVYPGAITASSRHPEDAARFLEFLRSDRAQEIFAKHGFLRLAAFAPPPLRRPRARGPDAAHPCVWRRPADPERSGDS